MARGAAFSKRATRQANRTRQYQRSMERKRQAARRGTERQQDVSVSISIDSCTHSGSDDVNAVEQTVQNPLLALSAVDEQEDLQLKQFSSQMKSEDVDELLCAPDDCVDQIQFGDFVDSASSTCSSSSGGCSKVFEAPKLWDEESQTWSSDYSRTRDRPGTGDSIESSASAMQRRLEQQQLEQAAQAYQAQQAHQQMVAFQQQQHQHAMAVQLQQTQFMHACYYEEQATTSQSRQQEQQKQRKQQQKRKQKSKQRQTVHEQYNHNGVQQRQQRQRRQEEGRRRQQALQYLRAAQHQETFLHPPLPVFPNLIPPPPYMAMMAHAPMNFMPQMIAQPYPTSDVRGASMYG